MISLFILSPKLTGLMIVAVTGLISAGSLLGSALRKLSRKAQAQVNPIIPSFALLKLVSELFVVVSEECL